MHALTRAHTHTHTYHSAQVMCADYGFRSGVGRMYSDSGDGTIPVSGFELAVRCHAAMHLFSNVGMLLHVYSI